MLMNALKDFEKNDFYKCVLQFLESMLSEFLLRNAKSMLLAHYAMQEVDQDHAHAIISLSLLCITLPFRTLKVLSICTGFFCGVPICLQYMHDNGWMRRCRKNPVASVKNSSEAASFLVSHN